MYPVFKGKVKKFVNLLSLYKMGIFKMNMILEIYLRGVEGGGILRFIFRFSFHSTKSCSIKLRFVIK